MIADKASVGFRNLPRAFDLANQGARNFTSRLECFFVGMINMLEQSERHLRKADSIRYSASTC